MDESGEEHHIQFRQYGEWTMVYLDGELVVHGDHYLAGEWLQERFNVQVVDDDAGHCMIDNRTPVPTLEGVEQRAAEALRRQNKAAALRQQASDLLAQAERVERG